MSGRGEVNGRIPGCGTGGREEAAFMTFFNIFALVSLRFFQQKQNKIRNRKTTKVTWIRLPMHTGAFRFISRSGARLGQRFNRRNTRRGRRTLLNLPSSML